MPTRHPPPHHSAAAGPALRKLPRRPAERRAALDPPHVPAEPTPGMLDPRWRTSTNQWSNVRGAQVAGVRHLPATSTLPSRPAGRAAAPGRRVIQTCAPSHRAKSAENHAPAVILTSGLRLAAAASMATTCTSRPARLSISIGTSLMSRTRPPTSVRAVAPQRAGMAPTRHTTRSRGSATAGQPHRTSPELSPAPSAGVDHGRPAGPRADPRLNPGSTTSKSSETNDALKN